MANKYRNAGEGSGERKEIGTLFFQRYQGKLLNYFLRETRSHHDAEDLTQDTFIHFLKYFASKERTDGFDAGKFIGIIARRRLTKFRREGEGGRNAPKKKYLHDGDEVDNSIDVFRLADISLNEIHPDGRKNEPINHEAEIPLKEIELAIRELPRQQRIIAKARWIEGLSPDDIAKRLDKPYSSVTSGITNAKRNLQKKFNL